MQKSQSNRTNLRTYLMTSIRQLNSCALHTAHDKNSSESLSEALPNLIGRGYWLLVIVSGGNSVR